MDTKIIQKRSHKMDGLWAVLSEGWNLNKYNVQKIYLLKFEYLLVKRLACPIVLTAYLQNVSGVGNRKLSLQNFGAIAKSPDFSDSLR